MTPEEFPAIFADGWSRAKPQGFVDFFLPLIATDAVFHQPPAKSAHGHQAIAKVFADLFALMPDMALEVRNSAVSGDTVYVESDTTGTIGRRRVALKVVDRFTIRDGLIAERFSYLDSSPIVRAVLVSPSAWSGMIKRR